MPGNTAPIEDMFSDPTFTSRPGNAYGSQSPGTLCVIPPGANTTSTSETWVRDLYPPGQCAYFVKTATFNELQDIVRQIAAHARGV